MGFDKNDPSPVIQPAKKTTQVNIWMVVAVLVFLALGGGAMLWLHHHSAEVTQGVDQQMKAGQH